MRRIDVSIASEPSGHVLKVSIPPPRDFDRPATGNENLCILRRTVDRLPRGGALEADDVGLGGFQLLFQRVIVRPRNDAIVN